MAREEATKLINAFDLPSKVVADKIYDDFESRTCENCKLEPKCILAVQVTHRPTFSCSDWESK